MRRAYDDVEITKGRERRERVTLKTVHHDALFDFAVMNGRVVQLTQTWSFQFPDQATLAEEVKAWDWTVQEARNAGGQILAAAEEFDVGKDVEIEAVYVPALQTKASATFTDAVYVFESLGVRAVPHDRSNEVAQRARQLLGS